MDFKDAVRRVPSVITSRTRKKKAVEGLTISFRNVQGIRSEAKQRELIEYVTSECIDFMAVVETHLKGDEKLDSSSAHDIVQKNRPITERGNGGIGAYVKKQGGVECTELNPCEFGIENDSNILVVSLSGFKVTMEKITVGVVYMQ
jgi:hypothetical protein